MLFVVLLGWYGSRLDSFGSYEAASIFTTAVAAVYVAMGQGIVILGGGIDLGIGSTVILANCVSAKYMNGKSLVACLVIAMLVTAASAAVGAVVGLIIHTSRVPDIIVTLATSFSLFGLALMILPSPGGGTHPSFAHIVTGSDSGEVYWPAAVCIAAPVIAVWLPLRRRRTVLSIYAAGSDANAAFLSGVNLRRTKVTSYAFGSFFAGLAGLATTAVTGGGEPRFSTASAFTLNAVAAAVLGGVALVGGVGGMVGPIGAALALSLLSPILTNLQLRFSWMDSNMAEIVKGLILILVVMAGGWARARRRKVL
jgi:ribose transport system permease protein